MTGKNRTIITTELKYSKIKAKDKLKITILKEKT